MNSRGGAEVYAALPADVSVKLLEKPYLYKRSSDELFELDDEALSAVLRLNGARKAVECGLSGDFLTFCLEEGLVELLPKPAPRPPMTHGPSPTPSLRYLELQITRRCNLACAHCYLGDARPTDLPPEDFMAVAREFERMGGLKIMVSGGEPLLHPHWEEINQFLADYWPRRILLTNGTRLDRNTLSRLNFDEVQISLDGMRAGHEAVRGPGAFDAAVGAARLVASSGLALSIATQAHRANLREFGEMEELVRSLGAREWGIDAPSVTGRLADNSSLLISPEEAADAMARAFGGSYHGGGGGAACGLHLLTVGADGKAAKCGFYFDEPLGSAEEGLAAVWARKETQELSTIKACAACAVAEDCGGGCRYRAGDPLLPDLVMCAAMGVAIPTGTP